VILNPFYSGTGSSGAGQSIQIAKEAVSGGADWIEAGTPLIKSEVWTLWRDEKSPSRNEDRSRYENRRYREPMEVEMAAKAGADIVAMLASSDNSTVEDALRAARKYGVQIMMDLLTVPDPVKRSVSSTSLAWTTSAFTWV